MMARRCCTVVTCSTAFQPCKSSSWTSVQACDLRAHCMQPILAKRMQSVS